MNVGELLVAATERLRTAGSESPRLDAELLMGHALGLDRTAVIAHHAAPVGTVAAETFEAALRRREAREPVAYIRGFREFHGLAFQTDPRALIPRPETELMVDTAVREVIARLTASPRPPGSPGMRVADIGTGSGAIAVSLVVALRKRRMDGEVLVIATDSSPDALELAKENAVGHAVADRIVFVVADLLPPNVDPPYAVICANLPYVATEDIDELEPELAYEPRLAFDGGSDGLDVIRGFLDRLPGVLAPGGTALLEIGADEEMALLAAVEERLPGWRCIVATDLAGEPRLARVERDT
jgi:release factor glutamine methyltransferase